MPEHSHTTRNPSPGAGGPRPPSTLRELLRQAARPFGFLLIFVMICAFLAQYLTGSETLQQYAEQNPEAAYGSPTEEPSPESTPGSTTEPSPEPTTESSPELTHESAPESAPESAADHEPAESPPVREASNEPPAYTISEGSTEATADREPPDPTAQKEENDTMDSLSERTTYQDGFYYEPLNDEVKKRITGISYPESGCTVPYEDLNYVGLLYVDFNGDIQEGELICNQAVAQDMVEIFYELYRNDYRIERIRLIDEYDGDDTLSMLDNNTSCFNYRVVDGTTKLSRHALGCAVDINPFYNPYVVFNKDGPGETYISPKGSEGYADRSQDFPYKIDETDLCYKLFTAHGFTWGGNWNSSKDYQHFQIILPGT